MITVHHLSTSHSHVVLWLLEELGEPYELVPHQREPIGRAPDSLRAVHPAGKSPTIVDHGQAMIESTGIILYILEAYGNGRLRPPPGAPEAMSFYQWLTFIEGSAKAPLIQLIRLLRSDPEAPNRAELEAAAAAPMRLIDEALAGQETIVPGQFTAADLQLAFFEEIADGRGQLGPWRNMRAHMERMRSRDAYQRAMAKGGPVMMTSLFAPAVDAARG